MSLTTTDVTSLPPEAATELRKLLADKASDLFSVCDSENKGFVTRRDMQRMRSELPLDPDQLEEVFDRLDCDGNGFLTLEEFTEGFGDYLGLECAAAATAVGDNELNDDHDDLEAELIEEEQVVKPNERRRHVGALVARAMTLAEVDEEDEFTMLLSELGILGLVEDDRALREMWDNLRSEDDPQMVANFEQFLTDLSRDLLQRSSERQQLETAAKTRSQVQEEHLRRLQEEMEAELTEERRRIREEEALKEKKLRENWERDLAERDYQVREAMDRVARLQAELDQERRRLPEYAEENTALQEERDRLQREVEQQTEMQREMELCLEEMRRQWKQDRAGRALSSWKVTAGVASERAGAAAEMLRLRQDLERLRDERDEGWEAAAARGDTSGPGKRLADELSGLEQTLKGHEELEEAAAFHQGLDGVEEDEESPVQLRSHPSSGGRSIDSPAPLAGPESFEIESTSPAKRASYAWQPSRESAISLKDELAGIYGASDSGVGTAGSPAGPAHHLMTPDEDMSTDDEGGNDDDDDYERGEAEKKGNVLTAYQLNSSSSGNQHSTSSARPQPALRRRRPQPASRDRSTVLEDTASLATSTTTGPVSFGESDDVASLGGITADPAALSNHPNLVHQQLTQHAQYGYTAEEIQPLAPYESVRLPERVFKIIFIGDSSVGKSSLVRRFCTGKFHPDLKSTIGVDFHTRSMLVEGQSICLQCWDTAGQERYRAITKSYFRKADAAVIVYDVTAERTFLNAREWLNSAVEAAGEDAALLLIGNKLDLADVEGARRVDRAEGAALSRQYTTLFGETSASDGRGVDAALAELAAALRQKEDRDLERALKLSAETEAAGKNKKKCCRK